MSHDFKTLKKDDAIALWKQGKWAWNGWVEKNPDYNIDFGGADFSEYDDVGFIGFHFPNGRVSFNGANFGDGEVGFSIASFGNGNVSFYETSFGNGNVSFYETSFGNGNVNFSEASFGDGDVLFIGASFGDGNVDFSKSNFGDGIADFSKSSFGDGNVDFSEANFGDGDVDFSKANFGNGKVGFSKAKFNGWALFEGLGRLSKVRSFSFKGATFEGPLYISSDGDFYCLIDLTMTKTSHHISLVGMTCILQRKGDKPWYYKLFPGDDWLARKAADDPEENKERARCLKNLAEDDNHHEKAKDLQIIGFKAGRVHKLPFDFLFKTDFWYEKLSDYGSSIEKPFCWIIGVWTLGALFYAYVNYTINGLGAWWSKLADSLIYSTIQMLPFLPSTRGIRVVIEKSMFCTSYCTQSSELSYYCEDITSLFHAATLLQNFFAFVLLFLLGLGIRFRYRI